jgi:hypothetical protein
VAQAADALGVTVDAIRSRIKRGTIAHVREGTRVYVVLGDDQGTTSRDQGSAQYADHHARDGHQDRRDPHDHRDELVEELRNRVRYLEEESRRKDAIIMTLAQRVPALEAAQEPRDAPQTPDEDAGRSEPRPTPGEAQEAAQPRSWWRRWFGFE